MYSTDKKLADFSYKKLNLSDSRIVLRTCLNVATDDQGKMTDATRFYESLPLIKELAMVSPNLVIMAHLGRPTAKEKQFSLWNVAEQLQNELIESGVSVHLVDDLTEANIEKIQNNENKGGKRTIFLLDNIRFYPEEDSKDKTERLDFARKLATLGDVFVNDAFADYRESASSYDIATLLPSYLGSAFMKEIEALLKLSDPKKPFVSILGGAKLSEKLDALKSLAEFSDKVIVGGAMAYTLLKAKGIEIGKSLVEDDKLDVAKEIMDKYSQKLILPVDHLVADEFDKYSSTSNITSQSIPADKIAIDLGSETIKLFKKEIAGAKTILWNGPMGVFEWSQSEKGTKTVIEEILNNSAAYKLAGGGDSIAALNKFEFKGFDHVSTGGGAMLAMLAYDKFPTLDVIINK